MMMKTMLPFVTMLLILASCKKYDSADINQDEIRQSYSVKYYAQQNVTEAEGSFRYKNSFGRRVILSGSASVSYAGQTLQYNNGLDVYSVTMSGNMLGQAFQFVNNNGQVYTNTVPAIAPINPIFNNTIYMDRSQPFLLSIGNVLNSGNGSVYRLYLGNRMYNGFRTYNNRLEFNISVNEMQNIPSGYYFANIGHSRSTGLAQDTNAGGTITVEYMSRDFVIYVF